MISSESRPDLNLNIFLLFYSAGCEPYLVISIAWSFLDNVLNPSAESLSFSLTFIDPLLALTKRFIDLALLGTLSDFLLPCWLNLADFGPLPAREVASLRLRTDGSWSAMGSILPLLF